MKRAKPLTPRCYGKYNPMVVTRRGCDLCQVKKSCRKMANPTPVKPMGNVLMIGSMVVVGADGKVRPAQTGETPIGVCVGYDGTKEARVKVNNGTEVMIDVQGAPETIRVVCCLDSTYAEKGIISYAYRFTDRLMLKLDGRGEVNINDAFARREFVELPDSYIIVRCEWEPLLNTEKIEDCGVTDGSYYPAYRCSPDEPSAIMVLNDELKWVRRMLARGQFVFFSNSLEFGAGKTQLKTLFSQKTTVKEYECVNILGLENRLTVGKKYTGAVVGEMLETKDDAGIRDSFLLERFNT